MTSSTSKPCAANSGGCAPRLGLQEKKQDLERRNGHLARELEETRAKFPRGISTS